MELTYLNPDLSLVLENVLLGLAWLGEATTDQIHRLWRPDGNLQQTRRILHDLKVQGWITSRLWTQPGAWMASRSGVTMAGR